jgi:hypothetical protein
VCSSDLAVFVGVVETEAALEAALTVNLSCDGDGLGSELSRQAGAFELANAPRETRVLAATTRETWALLDGLSFSAALRDALPAELEPPCNAIVLLFGVEAGAQIVRAPGVELRSLPVRPRG